MSDLTQYLSEETKREIAEQMFRERVAEHLKTDTQVTNFLYRMHEALVADVLKERMGDDWIAKVYEHTKKSISKLSSFEVFRKGDPYTDQGPGYKYLVEAVEKHAARIEGRVLRRIEDLDDDELGYLLRSALAKRLGDSST